ncbi:unnamed protein product [Mytilus edulis]|uniref:DZIP3-like HEPN domain-containing protein n=1 Tax=Mytilus edulis TaxID=6550 RepID=A0A8S3TTG1_MYTED|nr:unnamed protein product [Mytilus edulis]
MAESKNDASEFRTRKYNTGKEDYDRLLSVFHTGTDVKRCLLTKFLREKRFILLHWLTDLNETFLRFDDVKRAIKRSLIIQVKDLEPSTIDILLKFHCFDMFWNLCLLNTRLEEVLNIHKDELLRIYKNSMTHDSISSLSTEQYAPSLSKNQWELLFKSGECCGIKGEGNDHEFSATKDISLSSLDETLNVLLLYTVCPLFQSVIAVCECQIQITKLAVQNSECQEIPILLVGGKYTKGTYTLSVVEKADEDLQVLKSVYSNEVMEANQNETEDDMHTDDVQKRINKHSHLKVVQLITNIAKDVLVDVLKARLSSANFGYALNGMKNRILPQLNNYGRHLLYPDVSSYSGDLSDLDISLLYIILRNFNTISPHSNGWGNMPKDDDRTLSANIDRIRFYKNKYVSHCSNQSLDEHDFLKIWKEIRQCIIELGAAEYKSKIDFLFTSEINPVMEQELLNTLRRLKETEEQYESYYFKIKEDLNEIKQHLCMTNMKHEDTEAATDVHVPIGFPNFELVATTKPHIQTAQEFLELQTKNDKQLQRSLQITGEEDMGIFKEEKTSVTIDETSEFNSFTSNMLTIAESFSSSSTETSHSSTLGTFDAVMFALDFEMN